MEEVRGLVKALTKAEAPEAIADVLRALAKAPVTVPILHELKCGAVVSKLRKHENDQVSTEAKLLIKQWKGLAAAAGVPQTKAPAPPPQKTHSFAVDDLGDPTRQAARKKLQATLGEDASDADSYPAAEAVELALHRKWPNLQQPDQKRDYVAKLRQLSFNLKKNSELRSDVNSRKLTAEKLLELDADQLATREKQEERRKMAEYQHDARSLDWERKNRDRMDKSIGIDNSKTMYPCGKCKSTKVSNYEKQTRSGDEPMTQFFECADCGHRWRF